jgi:kynurenine 3-monooxygenase
MAMLHTSRTVTILGAGLVGSLLSILLKKRGYAVQVFERRPDMRKTTISAGRSINLATSNRGWKALDLAGLKDEIMQMAIPMYGRHLHLVDGAQVFQPYSKNNEAIYSVSRGELNKKLLTLAEQEGVTTYFDHKCTHVDVEKNTAVFQLADGTEKSITADLLFGADGAFSALFESYRHLNRVNCDQHYLDYAYKELTIVPSAGGTWQMEKNALHIWPRGNFMLIALPNADGTYTCTLFLPFEGAVSFANLDSKEKVTAFFETYFADAIPMMPDYLADFFSNPTASLVTKHISKWHHKDKSALIGDAAHAIVPFYGQGMNAGFEDCTVLMQLLDAHHDDWGKVLPEYEVKRRPNGDAVAALAIMNFAEMRDKVNDPAFLEMKKIEKQLGIMFPEKFISVYEMVSFSHIPYNTAIACISAQTALLQKIMADQQFWNRLTDTDYLVALQNWVDDYHAAVQNLEFK